MSEDEFVSIKPSFGRNTENPKPQRSQRPQRPQTHQKLQDSHIESKDAYNEKPPIRRKPEVDPDATEESEVEFNVDVKNKSKKNENTGAKDAKGAKGAKGGDASEKPENVTTDDSFFSQNKTIIVIIVFVIILVIVVIWIFVKDPKKNPFKSADDPLMQGPPGSGDPRMIGPPPLDPRDPRRLMGNMQNPQNQNPRGLPPPQNQNQQNPQNPNSQNSQNPNMPPLQNMPPVAQQAPPVNHNDLVQSPDADEEAIRYMQRKKMMHDEQKRRGKIEVIESDDEHSEENTKSKPAKSPKAATKKDKKTAPKKKGKSSAKNSKKSDDDINDEDLDNLTMHSDDEATDAEGLDDLEELEFSDEETEPTKKPAAKKGRKPGKAKK